MSEEDPPAGPPPWLAWACRQVGGGPRPEDDGSPFGRSRETLLRILAPELGDAYDEGRIDAERLAVYVEETAPFPDAVVAVAVRVSLETAPTLSTDELRDALADLVDELDEAHDALMLEALARAADAYPSLPDDPEPGAPGAAHARDRPTSSVGTTSPDRPRPAPSPLDDQQLAGPTTARRPRARAPPPYVGGRGRQRPRRETPRHQYRRTVVDRRQPEPEQRLAALIWSSAWLTGALEAARAVDLPQWWVGGGVLRDLVWDSRAGLFDPARVKDVDLAFFDADDLRPERDGDAQRALRDAAPSVPWDAKNQAAVHTWYPRRFGIDVEPLHSAAEGVATWPETATAVAVRLDHDGRLLTTSVDGGVHDLLDGICRRNPRRVTVAEYRRRLDRKDVSRRWPDVRVVDEP